MTVATGCGELVVGTAPGAGWQFDAGSIADRTPIVDASSRSLAISAGGDHGWYFAFDSDGIDRGDPFGRTRDTWHLTLPTTDIEDLTVKVNAGLGRIDLPGARIGNLDLTTNAGMTSADLTGTSVASLSGTVNAGTAGRQPASGGGRRRLVAGQCRGTPGVHPERPRCAHPSLRCPERVQARHARACRR